MDIVLTDATGFSISTSDHHFVLSLNITETRPDKSIVSYNTISQDFHTNGTEKKGYEILLGENTIKLTEGHTYNYELSAVYHGNNENIKTETRLGINNLAIHGVDNIPEPSTVTLSLLGLGSLLLKRRRRNY